MDDPPEAQKPEAPKPVARSGSIGAQKTEAAKPESAAAAASSTKAEAGASSTKADAEDAGTESGDVKDLMKMLVRDAKKAAAQAVEPTASPTLSRLSSDPARVCSFVCARIHRKPTSPDWIGAKFQSPAPHTGDLRGDGGGGQDVAHRPLHRARRGAGSQAHARARVHLCPAVTG